MLDPQNLKLERDTEELFHECSIILPVQGDALSDRLSDAQFSQLM